MLEVVGEVAGADPYYADLLARLRAGLTRRAADGIRRLQRDGRADPALDPDDAAPLLCGMVEALAARSGAAEPPDPALATLTRLWAQAIGLPPPRALTPTAKGPPAMQFTAEHDQVRKVVRDFVDAEINPYVDQWEADGIFPAHELFARLGALGLLGLEYDPAYGGQGADHSYTVVLGEELARIDCAGIPMAIAVQTVDGDARAGPVRLRGAQAALPRAGDPRRGGLLDRGLRGRRRVATSPASAPARCATATTG